MARSTHRLTGLTVALVLSTCLCICSAQEVGGERYYLFQTTGISTPQREKQLTELLRGFDGEMVVSIDRPTQRLKLLTTVVLDGAELITMAGQIGVSLVAIPFRLTTEGTLVNE